MENKNEQLEEKKETKFLSGFKELLKSFIVSLVIVVVLTQFIIKPVVVEGKSMYPTLQEGEFGFSNIIGLKLGEIQRFDIVVIKVPDQNKNIVKRVIGLPGDTVEFRDNKLYINNTFVEEPFLDNEYVDSFNDNTYFTVDFGPLIVPPGEYFVAGDNRQNSSDSRNGYGTFSKENVISKGVMVLYPFDKFGWKGR